MSRRHRSCLVLVFAAWACLFFQVMPIFAADQVQAAFISVSSGEVRSLQVGVGRSMIVDLSEDAQEIFVGEPKIANAIVRSARRIYLTTLTAGQTTIFVLGPNGRKIAVLEVTVGRDVEELDRLLKAAIPGNDIHVRTVGGSIILTGSVASAGDAQQALDISQGFISDGGLALAGGGGNGKVINSLLIRGLDQVSLRVTISEIRREVLKQLGISYSGTGAAAGAAFPTGVSTLSLTNSKETATIGWMMGGEKLQATLNTFEQEGVSRTLSEPTVTAVSGGKAQFLAGGTIPLINGYTCTGGTCNPTVAQQPYGVTLNFSPVVLSEGRIQLHIETTVNDIDTSKSIQLFGASVPGFLTRTNQTTVELPSGGSIVSAGLMSTQTGQTVSGLPGLMDVPVLGALFRSRDFQRQETELLIVVTPYIVHAVDPKDVVRPDQNFMEASDPQAVFLGRINRIYSNSGNLKPMPNYTGRVGFITD